MEGAEPVYRVEVVHLSDGRILASGNITKSKADEMGLMLAPDDVIRISDILWDSMIPENREALLNKFNCF
jgi:hypothetical protein